MGECLEGVASQQHLWAWLHGGGRGLCVNDVGVAGPSIKVGLGLGVVTVLATKVNTVLAIFHLPQALVPGLRVRLQPPEDGGDPSLYRI